MFRKNVTICILTYAAKYAAFFDRVMIPPYGWARSKKALVASNVATATDYYKEAYGLSICVRLAAL